MLKTIATRFLILVVALMAIPPSVSAQVTTQAQRETRYTRYLLKLYLMLKIFSTVLIFRLPNIISFPEKSANPITNGQFIGKMITLIQGKLIFFTIKKTPCYIKDLSINLVFFCIICFKKTAAKKIFHPLKNHPSVCGS